MTAPLIFYCSCHGEERPLKDGYIVTDGRYALVRCGGYDRTATSNRVLAESIIADRLARKAAAEAEKIAAKERRAKEIAKERKAAFGR
jgi:hypothetical protein